MSLWHAIIRNGWGSAANMGHGTMLPTSKWLTVFSVKVWSVPPVRKIWLPLVWEVTVILRWVERRGKMTNMCRVMRKTCAWWRRYSGTSVVLLRKWREKCRRNVRRYGLFIKRCNAIMIWDSVCLMMWLCCWVMTIGGMCADCRMQKNGNVPVAGGCIIMWTMWGPPVIPNGWM